MIIQRQKLFSIQSGGDQGSLGKELRAKLTSGLVAGGALGAFSAMLPLSETNSPNRGKWALGIFAGCTALGGLIAAASTLGADRRKKAVSGWNMNDILERVDEEYFYDTKTYHANFIYDKNPDDYMVTFAFENGSLFIILNKPTPQVLECLNDNLKNIIKFNRRASYISVPIKEGYVVVFEASGENDFISLIGDIVCALNIPCNFITYKKVSDLQKKYRVK